MTRQRRWAAAVLAALAGAIAALGQVPLSLFPVTLPGLSAVLLLGARARTPGRAFLTLWAGGSGWFLVSLVWVVEPFLVEPEKTLWLAPFGVTGLCLGLALFWGGAGWLAAWVAPRSGSGARLCVLVVALALAELARGTTLTGFPWALPAYVWADTPVIQWAALIGPYGLTAITLALAGCFARLAGRARKAGRAELRLALSVAAATGLLLGWGAVADRRATPPDRPATVRIVQPNAAQNLKWRDDMAPIFFARLLDLTAARPEGRSPDLVIWPETAIRPILSRAGPDLARIAASAPPGARVALGLRRMEGARFYNSLVLLEPDGWPAAVYDKIHLVPFGEYIPLGSVLGRLGLRGLAAEDGGGFSAGATRRPIEAGRAGRFLPLICYEAIFPEEIHPVASASASRADWILQITNDAWFGTFAGPQQHLAQARFRAVEQGLPVLRAANTGISAVIDARGHVRASLPLGRAGFLDAPIPAALAPPPYARIGDFPLSLLLLAAIALVFRRVGKLGD